MWFLWGQAISLVPNPRPGGAGADLCLVSTFGQSSMVEPTGIALFASTLEDQ